MSGGGVDEYRGLSPSRFWNRTVGPRRVDDGAVDKPFDRCLNQNGRATTRLFMGKGGKYSYFRIKEHTRRGEEVRVDAQKSQPRDADEADHGLMMEGPST